MTSDYDNPSNALICDFPFWTKHFNQYFLFDLVLTWFACSEVKNVRYKLLFAFIERLNWPMTNSMWLHAVKVILDEMTILLFNWNSWKINIKFVKRYMVVRMQSKLNWCNQTERTQLKWRIVLLSARRIQVYR